MRIEDTTNTTDLHRRVCIPLKCAFWIKILALAPSYYANCWYCVGGLVSLQQTPLHVAARNGKADTVRYLVDKGADINIKDDDGVSESDYHSLCVNVTV